MIHFFFFKSGCSFSVSELRPEKLSPGTDCLQGLFVQLEKGLLKSLRASGQSRCQKKPSRMSLELAEMTVSSSLGAQENVIKPLSCESFACW